MVAYIYPLRRRKKEMKSIVDLWNKLSEIHEYYSSKLYAHNFCISDTEWKKGKEKYLKELKQIAEKIMTLDESRAPFIRGKISNLEDIVEEVENPDKSPFGRLGDFFRYASIAFIVDFCNYLADTLIKHFSKSINKE